MVGLNISQNTINDHDDDDDDDDYYYYYYYYLLFQALRNRNSIYQKEPQKASS